MDDFVTQPVGQFDDIRVRLQPGEEPIHLVKLFPPIRTADSFTAVGDKLIQDRTDFLRVDRQWFAFDPGGKTVRKPGDLRVTQFTFVGARIPRNVPAPALEDL